MSRRTKLGKTLRTKVMLGVRMMMASIRKGGEASIDVEVNEGDSRTLPVWHAYGLTSHAPAGGSALLLFPNADSDDGGAILVQAKELAPTLEKGEVALWNTSGAIIILKADGSIEITGNVKINGDIEATNITATGDIKAGQISLKTHTHMTPQGPTGVPLP